MSKKNKHPSNDNLSTELLGDNIIEEPVEVESTNNTIESSNNEECHCCDDCHEDHHDNDHNDIDQIISPDLTTKFDVENTDIGELVTSIIKALVRILEISNSNARMLNELNKSMDIIKETLIEFIDESETYR